MAESPNWGVDTRMSFIPPITSPSQAGNRVLPSWGGAGRNMVEGLQGFSAGVGTSLSLGDITVTSIDDVASPLTAKLYIAGRYGVTAIGAYHGYQRTGTILGAIGYSMLASFLPLVAMGVMTSQGVGEKG